VTAVGSPLGYSLLISLVSYGDLAFGGGARLSLAGSPGCVLLARRGAAQVGVSFFFLQKGLLCSGFAHTTGPVTVLGYGVRRACGGILRA